MRNRIVNTQFDHLRIDHNQLYIIGTCFVEQRDDDGVHAHGLTGAGSTCNQHMGQLGDVTNDAVATNVLTNGECRLGLGILKLIGVDDLSQRNRCNRTVGNLNTNHRNLTRNGCNTDTRSTKAQSNVIGDGSQLIQTNTLIQLYFITGNTGTAGYVDNMRLNLKAGQSFVQTLSILPHFGGTIHNATGAALQQINGRKTIDRLLDCLILRDFLSNLGSRLCSLLCRHLLLYFRGGSRCFLNRRQIIHIQLRHIFGQIFNDVLLRCCTDRLRENRIVYNGYGLCLRLAHRRQIIGLDLAHHFLRTIHRLLTGFDGRDYDHFGCRRKIHHFQFQNSLCLFLATLLFHMFDSLVADEIHNCGCRILRLFRRFPLSAGTILNGTNNARNGNVAGCQQRQQCTGDQNDQRQNIMEYP